MVHGRDFVRRFLASEMIGIFFGAPVALAYVFLLIDFGPEVGGVIVKAAVVATVTVVTLMALPTNHYLTRGLAAGIDRFHSGRLSGEEAARLYHRLNRLGYWHGFWIFARISIGGLGMALYLIFWRMQEPVAIFSGLYLAMYGAYIAGLVALMFVFHLTRQLCEAIVATGCMDGAMRRDRQYFGLGIFWRSFICLVIPAIFTNISIYIFFTAALMERMPTDEALWRLIGVLLVNLFTLTAAIFLIVGSLTTKARVMNASLGAFAADTGDLTRSIPTTLTDEFDYISHLINRAILHFRHVLGKIKETGAVLSRSMAHLSAASHQIHATANGQAASVKEIVSTMEDSDERARRIGEHVREVVEIAARTLDNVERGVSIIGDNREKMDAIRGAHAETIAGIRRLTEGIKGIWEVVGIINGIAGQTRIIAFNAELEASAVGPVGKNFEIVADEVRRLADSTVDSTQEIRGAIEQLQSAGDSLIRAAESGTARVEEGWALSRELEAVFGTIREAADLSNSSADRIAAAIHQQISGFEQILLTLKDISTGIDHFAASTADTNQASESIQATADDLNRIVLRYTV